MLKQAEQIRSVFDAIPEDLPRDAHLFGFVTGCACASSSRLEILRIMAGMNSTIRAVVQTHSNVFMRRHAVATMLLVMLPTMVHAQLRCIDPATPLRTLAASYDRWPALPPGNHPLEARAKFDTFLATGNETDYHKALLAYQNLETDYPGNRAVRLALGLLYASGPDLNYRNSDGYRHVTMLIYSNADTKAARQLQSVLREDSTQWITAIAMTRVALVTIETKRIPEAYAAIQRALTADPSNTALHLAWTDLLNREGHYAEARQYIEAHVGNCIAEQNARAESLMLTGDTATGSRLYLESLERAGPAELDRYYDDARVMMTVAYSKMFSALPAQQRATWLRAYWERTAAASSRSVETRVAEQIIRAAYADAHYRSYLLPQDVADKPLAVITDTSHVVPWDAAGVYYVRHGPPDFRYSADEGAVEYMAWVYLAMQPPVIVLMGRGKLPPTDWIPLYFPPCPSSFLGRFNAKQSNDRIATGIGMTMRDIYYALSPIDRRFGVLIGECQFVAMGMDRIKYDELVVQYRYDNRKILPRLAQSESALPHFTKPVRMAAAAYEFRTPDGQPEVIALSSIPVTDLRDGTSAARTLRLTYTVTDSATGSLRRDTMIALPPSATTGLVRVPVIWRSPSITNGIMRVTVTDPSDSLRGATKAIPFNVRADRSAVSLSDIVIADVGAPGPLVRGAFRLSPLPEHMVKTGDSFRVYFEMYGIAEGEDVQTTIVIRRTDQKTIREQLHLKGKREDKTVAFNEKARLDPRGIAVRDVEVGGDLIAGTYSIEVTVKTPAGVTANRVGALRVE